MYGEFVYKALNKYKIMDNDNKDKDQRRGFPVEITEDIAEGTYANFALIGHSQTEFLLDFAKTIPGQQKAKIKSRVIMSPIQAKRLLRALQDNVAKYEQDFGEINTQPIVPRGGGNDNGSMPPPFMGFNGTGEA